MKTGYLLIHYQGVATGRNAASSLIINYMTKQQRNLKKLVNAGISVYEKDVRLKIIRKLKADVTWGVICRCRTDQALEKRFEKIMRDPRAIEYDF